MSNQINISVRFLIVLSFFVTVSFAQDSAPIFVFTVGVESGVEQDSNLESVTLAKSIYEWAEANSLAPRPYPSGMLSISIPSEWIQHRDKWQKHRNVYGIRSVCHRALLQLKEMKLDYGKRRCLIIDGSILKVNGYFGVLNLTLLEVWLPQSYLEYQESLTYRACDLADKLGETLLTFCAIGASKSQLEWAYESAGEVPVHNQKERDYWQIKDEIARDMSQAGQLIDSYLITVGGRNLLEVSQNVKEAMDTLVKDLILSN